MNLPLVPGASWTHVGSAVRLWTNSQSPRCIAVLLKAGRHWRACIRLPAPQVLTPRFDNLQDAAYVLEKICRDTTSPEYVYNTVHPGIDSRWQEDHDCGSSRAAGGVYFTVRPRSHRGLLEWQLWLGADRCGPLHPSRRTAEQWLDALLPPPPPREVENALRELRRGTLLVAVRFPHGADVTRRRRANAYMAYTRHAWRVLAQNGMDEDAEERIVRAWCSGLRVCVTWPGHAGVMV